MPLDPTLLASAGAGIAAVLVLRASWQLRQRSPVLNGIGWTLMAAAITLGWHNSGAWGAAVATLSIMGCAYAALLGASLAAPDKQGRTPAFARRTAAPEKALHPAHRLATFTLVGFGGLFAAIAMAISFRWLAAQTGVGEADANVLALFVAPVAYAILTFALLMSNRRSVQLSLLGACIVTAAPAMAAGNVP